VSPISKARIEVARHIVPPHSGNRTRAQRTSSPLAFRARDFVAPRLPSSVVSARNRAAPVTHQNQSQSEAGLARSPVPVILCLKQPSVFDNLYVRMEHDFDCHRAPPIGWLMVETTQSPYHCSPLIPWQASSSTLHPLKRTKVTGQLERHLLTQQPMNQPISVKGVSEGDDLRGGPVEIEDHEAASSHYTGASDTEPSPPHQRPRCWRHENRFPIICHHNILAVGGDASPRLAGPRPYAPYEKPSRRSSGFHPIEGLSSRSRLACSVHSSHGQVHEARYEGRGPSGLLDMSNKIPPHHGTMA